MEKERLWVIVAMLCGATMYAIGVIPSLPLYAKTLVQYTGIEIILLVIGMICIFPIRDS